MSQVSHRIYSADRRGKTKPILMLILIAFVAGAFYLMTQEQAAREYCERINNTLAATINEPSGPGLTPKEVHEKIGVEPNVTRTPGKHKYVEEYTSKGPMDSYVVYAYYKTGATKLLEAVSLNQKLDDWETE